jgi:acetoin utilization deacetylase AcuC-like enzyme
MTRPQCSIFYDMRCMAAPTQFGGGRSRMKMERPARLRASIEVVEEVRRAPGKRGRVHVTALGHEAASDDVHNPRGASSRTASAADTAQTTNSPAGAAAQTTNPPVGAAAQLTAAEEAEALVALRRVHSGRYIASVRARTAGVAEADRKGVKLSDDSDTMVTRGTWPAALAAVRLATLAVDAVAANAPVPRARAFAAVRPPGHHAGFSGEVSRDGVWYTNYLP